MILVVITYLKRFRKLYKAEVCYFSKLCNKTADTSTVMLLLRFLEYVTNSRESINYQTHITPVIGKWCYQKEVVPKVEEHKLKITQCIALHKDILQKSAPFKSTSHKHNEQAHILRFIEDKWNFRDEKDYQGLTKT